MHALIYSKKADEVRRVFKDVLRWRDVDAGEGWLIFAAPPTELAVHPSDEEYHELYLMCDDIGRTVADFKKKGIPTTRPVADQGYGLVTALRLPSGAELGLYEPRHPTAIRHPRARRPTKKRRTGK